MSTLLPLLFLPPLFIPLIYVLGLKIGKKVGWVTLLPLLCITSVIILLTPTITHEHLIFEEYIWAPIINLTLGLLIDGLTLPALITLSLVFTAAAAYSIKYMEHRIGDENKANNHPAYAAYYAVFLVYFAGIMGALLSTNLIEFYIFYEVAVIGSWALIYAYGYGARGKIALSYFIWTHLGAVSLLIGILLIGWRINSYSIADLHLLSGDPMVLWIVIAILICFLIKMAIVGLHSWLPDTYAESPAPISAAIGATSVVFGTYSAVRLITPLRGVLLGFSGWLELWAMVTIAYGGLLALAQTDTKRLVAFLSMSQMNYCLLGIFTYTIAGTTGAISYSLSHGLAIALLFLTAGAILNKAGTRDMTKLGGLAEKMPFIIVSTIIGFFTIGGVPPTIGFKSKFILMAGAFDRAFMSSPLELTIAIAAVMITMVTVAYELWAVWRVFYGRLPSSLRGVTEAPLSMAVPVLILALTSLILGIWPAVIMDPLEFFINTLFGVH